MNASNAAPASCEQIYQVSPHRRFHQNYNIARAYIAHTNPARYCTGSLLITPKYICHPCPVGLYRSRYLHHEVSKMVSSRKRGRLEMEAIDPPKERSLLDRIRNMWEFANLAQWIFIFGRAVKIDENLDVEVSLCSSALCTNPLAGLLILRFSFRNWKWSV
jgi:hypothetical protein